MRCPDEKRDGPSGMFLFPFDIVGNDLSFGMQSKGSS